MQTLLLIICSVTMSALAQLLLKTGMSSARIQEVLEDSLWNSILTISTSVWVIGGLVLYGFGAGIWLFVLARVDLSYAYPFVGLGFILTMLFGVFFLGEAASPTRITGTLMVAFGIVLIARAT